MKDHYQTLGIERGATDSEIKKAFRTLAQKYHPDKKGGNESKFKEASEAYAVLGNKKRRAEYDTGGQSFNGGGFDFSQFQQGGVDIDLGDIFGEMFGGRQQRARRGRDISMDIELDFKDAAFGVDRSVLITKTSYCSECDGSGAKDPKETKTCSTCNGHGSVKETRRSMLGTFTSNRECSDCNGTGKIPKVVCKKCKGHGVLNQQDEINLSIPAGIDNGEMIRLPERGEAIKNGKAGDLYVKVHVRPHKDFIRNGSDLRMNLKIKMTDALLGATYSIPTLEKEIDLKIPAGVTHGEILRIAGKGIPKERSGRGDLLVTIQINLPKKLSKSAKKLVEELKSEGI
ncbi:molecular chaperone DnaJ [Candidatus Kaiserbacteria bacterium]|nr:MAG: molecular chaperone DnaJ [Candidatus Kaiserbacteria bacterium]